MTRLLAKWNMEINAGHNVWK